MTSLGLTAPKIQPSQHGGYGRRTGPSGGLQGVEFTARCPPDVQVRTRIIAVCGVPESDAAPHIDGWFFSDFFLFYQMLGNRDDFPNQLWFSSCSPKKLIAQHGRYLHGPANGIESDRRVVMNENMLPKNEFDAGFRICAARDLLGDFLGALRSEMKIASETMQPLLVLMFGHGGRNNSGIFIGCDEDGFAKLTHDRFASVLNKNVQTTLITTSCYSGGWVIRPNYTSEFSSPPRFNNTIFTAAGSKNTSLAWPTSKTFGKQAGGGFFATCLINSIITTSNKPNGYYSGETAIRPVLNPSTRVPTGDFEEKLVKVREDDAGNELSFTTAALAQQITYECRALFGELWGRHNFSYAVQDDLWDQAWDVRTGMPVSEYKKIWENLPKAPVKEEIYKVSETRVGSAMSKSPMALQKMIKFKAISYMNSKPGLDNSGSNTNAHGRFNELIRGDKTLSYDELYQLNETLDYREGQVRLAELYCHVLDIGVKEGRRVDQFDEDQWEGAQLRQNNAKSTGTWKKFDDIRGLLDEFEVFDAPHTRFQGLEYTKPTAYLSARLAETQLSTSEIRKRLEQLVQFKLAQGKLAADSVEGRAILGKAEIKVERGRLYNTCSRLKHRLRSLSPVKSASRTQGTTLRESAREGSGGRYI